MNFRNTNTLTYNLKDEHVNIQSYQIVDKVPQEVYREVLMWSIEKLDINKMTVSISDHKAQKTILMNSKPAVVVDGLGMCEIELRGALQSLDIKGHKSVTVNTSFLPILHYSNGINAMTMILSREDSELEDALNEIVLPVLRKTFKEVNFSMEEEDIDMTMTTVISTQADVDAFLDEDVRNILTVPFDLEGFVNQLK